ncbi:MAG: hypothetical protein ACI4V3_06955 [Faecousia sp.]
MRNYDIYDETGKRVYFAEQQLWFLRCWHIFDTAERHLATVQKRFGSIKLMIHGACVDIAYRRGLRRKYRFSTREWNAACMVFADDFVVRTPQGKTVALAEGAPEKNSFRVESTREEDALLVLLFAVGVRKHKFGLRI